MIITLQPESSFFFLNGVTDKKGTAERLQEFQEHNAVADMK